MPVFDDDEVRAAAFIKIEQLRARYGARIPRAMLIEVGMIALATLIALVFDITPNHFSGDLIIGLLAFAMSLRNATVRRLKIPDLTTTVLTMTLTGFAAESQLACNPPPDAERRLHGGSRLTHVAPQPRPRLLQVVGRGEGTPSFRRRMTLHAKSCRLRTRRLFKVAYSLPKLTELTSLQR